MTVLQVRRVADMVVHTLLKAGEVEAGWRVAMMPAPVLKRMAERKPVRKVDQMTYERKVNEILAGLRERAKRAER